MPHIMSGELATVTFRCRLEARPTGDPAAAGVPYHSNEYERQERALAEAAGATKNLHSTLTEELGRHIRRGTVYVDPLIVRPGSVEVLAVIGGAALLVKNIAEITTGISEAVEATRRALAALMGNANSFQAVVSARIVEGPALLDARRQDATSDDLPAAEAAAVSPSVAPGSVRLTMARVVLPYYLGALLAAVVIVAILRFT